jgi:hypothetical protein
MRRLSLALSLALIGIGSLAPLSGAHAQATRPGVSATPSSVQAGGSATIRGQRFTPHSWVRVSFQRPDGTAGAYRIRARASGRFASLLGFKAGHGCGAETIRAYDSATGVWSAPTTVSVTGCGGPAAPSDLTVVSTTISPALPQPATVTLQWRDNSSNESGFRIRTAITRLYGGTGIQTQEAAAGATTAAVSFVAGGFNPVKSVCFTVTAFTAAAESAPSGPACVQLIG